jgi:hypothetical protein
MWFCQTFASNSCPDINSELLVVSRMDYTVRILLYPVVFVVNVDDPVVKHASYVVNSNEAKEWSAFFEQNADKSSFTLENLKA